MYVTVYSPQGEMFEVIRDRADDLILMKGWTQSLPVPAVQQEEVEEAETPTIAREESEAEEFSLPEYEFADDE